MTKALIFDSIYFDHCGLGVIALYSGNDVVTFLLFCTWCKHFTFFTDDTFNFYLNPECSFLLLHSCNWKIRISSSQDSSDQDRRFDKLFQTSCWSFLLCLKVLHLRYLALEKYWYKWKSANKLLKGGTGGKDKGRVVLSTRDEASCASNISGKQTFKKKCVQSMGTFIKLRHPFRLLTLSN